MRQCSANLEPGQPTTFDRPEILSVQHLFNLAHKFGGLNRVEHGVAVWIDRPEDAVGCGQEAIEVACGIEGSTGGIFEARYYLTSICPEFDPHRHQRRMPARPATVRQICVVHPPGQPSSLQTRWMSAGSWANSSGCTGFAS